MRQVFFSVLLFSFVVSCSHKKTIDKTNDEDKLTQCLSTREFITTREYLQSLEEIKIKPEQVLEISHKVAEGCTGSAQRFISVVDLLHKAKLDATNAIKTAIYFAPSDDKTTRNFREVFKFAYLESGLDLDLHNSIQMALNLSKDYQGEQDKAYEEFKKLIDFCTNMKKMNLPLGTCGSMAVRITKKGEKFQASTANAYISLFNFLVEDSVGPKVSVLESVKLAEELLEQGPQSEINFIQAYKYALSKKGLNYSKSDSFKFAQKMAKLTIKTDNLP